MLIKPIRCRQNWQDIEPLFPVLLNQGEGIFQPTYKIVYCVCEMQSGYSFQSIEFIPTKIIQIPMKKKLFDANLIGVKEFGVT